MGNRFNNLTPSQLKEKALNAYTVIEGSGDPNAYGVPDATLTELNTNQGLLGTAISLVESTKAAYESALQDREEAFGVTVESLSSIGNVIYNNPEVTDGMIAAAGYAVRDTVRTPVVPVTPTELVAQPFADGTVKLKWNRNGGRYGIVYNIEARADSSSQWLPVLTTTRQREVVEGFAPGVATWFRVVATRNSLTAPASEPISIYLGSGSTTLSLAA